MEIGVVVVCRADHPPRTRHQVRLWVRRRTVLQVEHERIHRGPLGVQRVALLARVGAGWARRSGRTRRRTGWGRGRSRRKSERGKEQEDAFSTKVGGRCRALVYVFSFLHFVLSRKPTHRLSCACGRRSSGQPSEQEVKKRTCRTRKEETEHARKLHRTACNAYRGPN